MNFHHSHSPHFHGSIRMQVVFSKCCYPITALGHSLPHFTSRLALVLCSSSRLLESPLPFLCTLILTFWLSTVIRRVHKITGLEMEDISRSSSFFWWLRRLGPHGGEMICSRSHRVTETELGPKSQLQNDSNSFWCHMSALCVHHALLKDFCLSWLHCFSNFPIQRREWFY